MKLSILDTGSASAEANMAIDAALLEELAIGNGKPTLHLYDWLAPSATYGYFTDPFSLLNVEAVTKTELQLARRPTGGGVIFHVADFAFSILIPSTHPSYSVNTLDNYATVNRMVIEVVQQFLDGQDSPLLLPTQPIPIDRASSQFCMANPTKYDVILDGRKVGGGAQRRTKHGFLHQGSISLAMPDEAFLRQVLLPGTRVLESMQQYTYALLPGSPEHDEIVDARYRLRDLICDTDLHVVCSRTCRI